MKAIEVERNKRKEREKKKTEISDDTNEAPESRKTPGAEEQKARE